MRFRDILALVLLVAVAVGGKLYRESVSDPPATRRPDPRVFAPPARVQAPIPDEGAPLPPESASDPRFIVEVDDKTESAAGTAFSIEASGIWVTARHVTEDCDIVALQKSERQLIRVRRIVPQPYADISILWTRGGAPALPLVEPQLRIGEDGYSFGFPQGDPGDLHARLIGRSRMLARGRYRTEEPVVAWTHIRRVPDRGTYLGGISGGPWLNAGGDVIGVHVAGAPRRGRSYSTAPESLLTAIREASVRPAADPARLPGTGSLSPRAFPDYGDRLRRQLTVAKVVCLVGDRWRALARQRQS